MGIPVEDQEKASTFFESSSATPKSDPQIPEIEEDRETLDDISSSQMSTVESSTSSRGQSRHVEREADQLSSASRDTWTISSNGIDKCVIFINSNFFFSIKNLLIRKKEVAYFTGCTRE